VTILKGSGSALGAIGLVRKDAIWALIWDGEVFTDSSTLIFFGFEDII